MSGKQCGLQRRAMCMNSEVLWKGKRTVWKQSGVLCTPLLPPCFLPVRRSVTMLLFLCLSSARRDGDSDLLHEAVLVA